MQVISPRVARESNQDDLITFIAYLAYSVDINTFLKP